MRWCYLITFLMIRVSAVSAQPEVLPAPDSAGVMPQREFLITLNDGPQFLGIGLAWSNDTLTVQNWRPVRESTWRNEPRRVPANQVATVEITPTSSLHSHHPSGMAKLMSHGWMVGGAMMIVMVVMLAGGLH